ncbi:uncharacterized protein LOC133171557 [Saccostrea echinata]|uniref:uncharacterized protein LOC133171557 n=1 Tax=Saccostrea echinata TaxID=191078 RepID=UPI002A816C1D|nr:uncharacterized protein LOC133171557 [Saccostrea echinata]
MIAFLLAVLLCQINEIQGQKYGVNNVKSVSKQYNSTTGFVDISVEMVAPEAGLSLTVYWQINSGVIGVDEPTFGSSVKKNGKLTVYSLTVDSSYVRAVYFTTKIADQTSSLRFESFSWGKDYPSKSTFPVQLRKCISKFSEVSSPTSDVHEINVDFNCDPPFSTNYYNWPRVYWGIKFGVYLFNNTDDKIFYQPIENHSERKGVLLSRNPRSTGKFSSRRASFEIPSRGRSFDRDIEPSKDLSNDNSVNSETLLTKHELANITIGPTPWAKISFPKSFLNERVVFLKVTLDAPLILGLGMVFSSVEKVSISKNLPPEVYLSESGGKTFPQPSTVTCQTFGENPPRVYMKKDGSQISKSENISIQEVRSPLFSSSYVTFHKKDVQNREIDGEYICFSENPGGDKNVSTFKVYTGPTFLEDLTKMTESSSRELNLRLVVEGNGQMRVSCHVPVPDHMVLINKSEKIEPSSTMLKRKEVTLTYKFPVEAVRPFDYFCSVYDEYGNHNTRYTHY